MSKAKGFYYDRRCIVCNAPFITNLPHKQTCSNECKIQRIKKYQKVRSANVESYRKYLRRRYWIKQLKQKIGCQECGFNKHHAALDFAHKNQYTKEHNISQLINTRITILSLFKEIRKCKILCSNCHRIETFENNHTRFRN